MSKSAARLVEWLLAASFALSLLAYAYLGSHSRYMADDFSISNIVTTHGLLGSQRHWYGAWTGRFSFTFVASLVALIGPATPRFIPGLLLTLWFVATVWAIYRISGSKSWAAVLLFAGFLIFATLETAPNLSQSLLWQTGALTYVAPLILVSLYVGLLSPSTTERHKRFPYKLFAGILTFVAGGFSDAYVVLQTTGLILSIVAVEIFAGSDFKSRIRPYLIAGLVGSSLALIIVAAAPGNTIRQSYFPKQFGGWELLRLTVSYSFRFVAQLVFRHPIVALTSVVLPLLVVLRDVSYTDRATWDPRLCVRLLLITPAAVLLLIMCCTASAVYAMSVMLPERARILLSFVFVCGTLVWGRAAGEYLAGKLLPARNTKKLISLAATAALLLLIVSPQMSFFSTLRLREEARSYAADWDRQDAELKTAKQNGVTDVVVPQIGDFQFRIGKGQSDLHLRTDPTFWINRATATYYGVRSVRANDDLATSRPRTGCQTEVERLKRTRLMLWANPRSCNARIPIQFKSISYQRKP